MNVRLIRVFMRHLAPHYRGFFGCPRNEGRPIGDVFHFAPPGGWTDPTIPTLTGHQRFTSAHWSLALRPLGTPTWKHLHARNGELSLSWPITEERGNGSRYPYAFLRDGLFTPTLKLERALIDPFFADQAESNTRLEAILALTGRQLDPTTRESITFTFASARIETARRSIKDPRTIAEEITLTGETDDAGNPPVTIEILTTRNWQPTP